MKSIKDRNRHYLLKSFGHLYDLHYSDDKGNCFYCGDFATVLDHCPPITEFELLKPDYFRKQKIPLVKISCCHSCNGMLGDRHLFTAYERVKYLEKKLMDQFDKRMSLWSDAETWEMSPMFQNIIKNRRKESKLLLNRARYAQYRLFKPDTFPLYMEPLG